ncbi:hypothetical protein MVEG_01457 [Podila verticillata NRRL 6337]|nr:hypothetical protein MVEG_01457 [Podila verticillata NRRL 6337]
MSIVLDYLTIQEAIQPSRVYSLWNEVFNRVVWRHCSIQDPALQAHHESLAKNAHHIRSLTCNLNATFRAFPVPCPHLASLKLNNREARKDHKGQARVACMVERNTILEELVIYLHSATTARLWGAIKAKYVTRNGGKDDDDYFDLSLDTYPNLTRLCLNLTQKHAV